MSVRGQIARGSAFARRRRPGIPRRSIGRDRRSASGRLHEPPGSARSIRSRPARRDARRSTATAVRRVAIDRAVWAVRIEFEHPVADDLKPDTADFRRLGANGPIVDRRKTQPNLRKIRGRLSAHQCVSQKVVTTFLVSALKTPEFSGANRASQ